MIIINKETPFTWNCKSNHRITLGVLQLQYSVLYFVTAFFRGMKYTRWESGVRGCSFVWSPLIQTPPRVSTTLMHIVDLLPSMLSAAGYDLSKLTNRSLDGIDQWQALSQNVPGRRTEVLLGIDPLDEKGTYALRMGDYKIIWSYPARDGWYKPEGVEIDGKCNLVLQYRQ